MDNPADSPPAEYRWRLVSTKDFAPHPSSQFGLRRASRKGNITATMRL